MKKVNVIMCSVILGLTMMNSGVVTRAADLTVMQDEIEAIGGWTESDGYFVNEQEYVEAMEFQENQASVYSSPHHTGKAEYRRSGKNDKKRAHGWTTWTGVYHYTRARMIAGKKVVTDSGRCWGKNGTEAISPWYNVTAVSDGSARTYYGH